MLEFLGWLTLIIFSVLVFLDARAKVRVDKEARRMLEEVSEFLKGKRP